MADKQKRARKDRKGATFQPAAYPKTDTAEVNSIKTIRSLIDESKVKTHINERDKLPNTDGYVAPVDKDNRPIGQIDVQVKTLSDPDIARRGHSCDEGFLGHCKTSTRPSILIGVDLKSESAYWEEITPSRVKKMEAEGSLTVTFPEANTITKGNDSYYEAWTKIIEKRQKQIEFMDGLQEDKAKQDALNKVLESIAGGVPIESGVDVEKVSAFLEELNGVLNLQLSIVMRTFHPQARKLGFAYSVYAKESLAFTVFEIGKQSTDADIKRIPSELAHQLLMQKYGFRSHYGENPIEVDPKAFARSLAKESLDKILEFGALNFADEVLAREMIFEFADKYHRLIGVELRDEYAVEDIFKGLFEYLPRWVANAVSKLSEQQRWMLGNVFQHRSYLDLDTLRRYFTPPMVDAISKETREHVQLNSGYRVDAPVGLGDIPLSVLTRVVTWLHETKVPTVRRLYPKFEYGRNPGLGLIYNWLSPDSFLEKTTAFYSHLPGSYDRVVELNFPQMRERLAYFKKFGRQVILVRARESYDSFDHFPLASHFDLKRVDGVRENRVDIFKFDAPEIAGIDFQEFEHPIAYNGNAYQLRSSGNGIADMFFKPLPLYNAILKQLRERFSEVFKSWAADPE